MAQTKQVVRVGRRHSGDYVQARPGRDAPCLGHQPGVRQSPINHLALTLMRRAVVAALAFFAFAPGAHAADPCGVTATPVVGSAPLTVTFTAGCASSGYAWSFGDGEEGLGQSVQHIYAAGAWHATLTTDA